MYELSGVLSWARRRRRPSGHPGEVLDRFHELSWVLQVIDSVHRLAQRTTELEVQGFHRSDDGAGLGVSEGAGSKAEVRRRLGAEATVTGSSHESRCSQRSRAVHLSYTPRHGALTSTKREIHQRKARALSNSVHGVDCRKIGAEAWHAFGELPSRP